MPSALDDPGPLLAWYAREARDLPWRAASVSPWAVLVSEVMLQQTPVVRVLPAYRAWLDRWPTPAALAVDPPAAAIRMWGRLGYPRRALRLHAAATEVASSPGGAVPDSYDGLRALPGVGDYTAAAVAAFAFGRRHAVLDTNVRRVHARALTGRQHPSASSPTAAECRRALDLLPTDGRAAARVSVAVMELGALVCTAATPDCGSCPLAARCAWRLAGHPDWDGPPRRRQPYAGTDRQCRGRLLTALREAPDPLTGQALDATWHDAGQRSRALDGLVADGLVEPLADGRYRLPEVTPASAPPRPAARRAAGRGSRR